MTGAKIEHRTFCGFDEVRFKPDENCPIPQESYEEQAVD
ncbi:MAG: hypothetical protein ACI84R_003610 [Candidatus Azotimanducaceae bacterium]|jgi:hypothetical protein